MSSDVRSIDALRDLHAGVVNLGEQWDDCVTQLRQLAHRFQERIRVERRQYWQSQLHLAERKLRMAEETRSRAKITQDPRDGARNTEAEVMVEKCKRRKKLCMEKIVVCRKLAAETDRVVDRFIGELGAMTESAESGLPNSANRLAKWIEALDTYADSSQSS